MNSACSRHLFPLDDDLAAFPGTGAPVAILTTPSAGISGGGLPIRDSPRTAIFPTPAWSSRRRGSPSTALISIGGWSRSARMSSDRTYPRRVQRHERFRHGRELIGQPHRRSPADQRACLPMGTSFEPINRFSPSPATLRADAAPRHPGETNTRRRVPSRCCARYASPIGRALRSVYGRSIRSAVRPSADTLRSADPRSTSPLRPNDSAEAVAGPRTWDVQGRGHWQRPFEDVHLDSHPPQT